MPQLGNGIDSAVIHEWPVVVVETVKATSDLESPVTGTLAVVHAGDGTEVEVGALHPEFDAAGRCR
jgi:pyruvate/2-oxoglutarate dehydrogenase complex dihydrolipoamide acyltransferase (E2) component